jgi:hypothetical protein
MKSRDKEETYATLFRRWLGDIMYGVESHEWGVEVEE